ncbi:MAG: hypothetical protein ACJ77A_03610 [Actinomycetota bacterium]
MRGRRAFGGLPVFAMAAGGVVAGHTIAYRLALPDVHLRHHVMLTTGHGHWLLVVKLGVAFALAGVATVVARFAGRTPPQGGSAALSWTICRLAVVQAVAFTGMEAVERLGSGVPVAGMFAHHLFALGLACQFLVACAGGAFLYWLSRAVRRFAEVVRALPHVAASPSGVVRPAAFRRSTAPSLHAVPIRGPPR